MTATTEEIEPLLDTFEATRGQFNSATNGVNQQAEDSFERRPARITFEHFLDRGWLLARDGIGGAKPCAVERASSMKTSRCCNSWRRRFRPEDDGARRGTCCIVEGGVERGGRRKDGALRGAERTEEAVEWPLSRKGDALPGARWTDLDAVERTPSMKEGALLGTAEEAGEWALEKGRRVVSARQMEKLAGRDDAGEKGHASLAAWQREELSVGGKDEGDGTGCAPS
jgi:hypothetical protein